MQKVVNVYQHRSVSLIARLKKRSEFIRVSNQGYSWITQGFILKAITCPISIRGPRVGFTVSKKVGNAVTRNLIKRRLREVIAKHFSDHANQSCDYVIIARANVDQLPYTTLEKDMIWALNKIKNKMIEDIPE